LENVKNLVIFSTLNQITNYIAIKILKPENIYNITFDEKMDNGFKHGISPKTWDENLEEVLKKDCENFKIDDNLKINKGMYDDLEEFKKLIEDFVFGKGKDAPIYWHVTGGQRMFVLKLYEVIKDRKNDVIFYLEGNTERFIVISNDDNKVSSEMNNRLENFKDLDFNTAFQLMGYDFKKAADSKIALIKNGKITGEAKEKNEEIKFYNILYEAIIEKNKKMEIELNEKEIKGKFEGTFKELFLKSNTCASSKNPRIEYLKELFKTVNLREIDPRLKNNSYDINNSSEIQNEFPAGYIFEKIVGYRIYNAIKEQFKEDNNCKIIGMEMSLKVYDDKFSHATDELDIALLTNLGRIINIECKSGSLKGDNAKSHNFTTYTLSGVFGAPIFSTPFNSGELDSENTICEIEDKDIMGKLKSACIAANKAKLYILYFNKLNEFVENL